MESDYANLDVVNYPPFALCPQRPSVVPESAVAGFHLRPRRSRGARRRTACLARCDLGKPRDPVSRRGPASLTENIAAPDEIEPGGPRMLAVGPHLPLGQANFRAGQVLEASERHAARPGANGQDLVGACQICCLETGSRNTWQQLRARLDGRAAGSLRSVW